VVVHEGKGDELDNDDVRSIRTIMLYELEQVDAKEEGQIERQQQQAARQVEEQWEQPDEEEEETKSQTWETKDY
jgi:hypothetical protein